MQAIPQALRFVDPKSDQMRGSRKGLAAHTGIETVPEFRQVARFLLKVSQFSVYCDLSKITISQNASRPTKEFPVSGATLNNNLDSILTRGQKELCSQSQRAQFQLNHWPN